jgi:hypothetical protein
VSFRIATNVSRAAPVLCDGRRHACGNLVRTRHITPQRARPARVRATLSSVAVEKSSKRRKPGLDLTKPVERPRIPYGVLFRMFVLGSVAVCASLYAIYRHYGVPRPSMLMPRTIATATAEDLEPLPPGFVAVPDLVPLPEPSVTTTPTPAPAPSRGAR